MKILFENKQLNEGPGAGYTIESSGYSLNGTLKNVKMTDLGSSIKFECDTDFTGTVSEFEASAYYAGTGKVNDLPISCSYVELEVSKDIAWNNELVDEDVTKYDEQQLLEEILDTLAGASCEFGYGGGYSHATYDGQVTNDYLSANYHDIKADIYLTNDEDIKKVDRMTNGYGYETMYEVVVDGAGEDAFEDEDEAIEYAKKIGAEEVRRIYETESWNGDIDIEGGETVWTNDDMDESIEKKDGKTLPKDIQKAVLGLLRTSNTLFSEKNMPYATDDELVSIVDDFIKLKERVMASRNTSESLNESFDEDDRIQALAEYLEVDPSEISNTYDYEYETPEGDYLVVTEDEAEQLAKDDIENLFDDLGLDSFTPDFKDWIIMNALDNDWFDEAVRESMESYVDDIAYEDGRLEEELLDAGIITEEDIENGYDEDAAREEYIEKLVYDAGDPVDYCGDNFGWDWVTQMATQHNLIDMATVVEQCIYEDGIAHFIARYDGNEIELGNGLYAYRTN